MVRRVLITGANRGLGRALARYYTSVGDQVFVFNRSVDPTLETELAGVGAFIGDVRDRQAVERFLEQADSIGAMPELFFLNAGVNRPDNLSTFDLTSFNEVMDINLNGVLNFIGSALPRLAGKPATFVASSSAATIFPNPNNLGYYISKLAEARLFRMLDQRHRRRGWRFKTLILGPISTDMVADSKLASKLQLFVRDLLTAKAGDAALRIARFVDSPKQTLHYTLASTMVFRAAALARALVPAVYTGAVPSGPPPVESLS
jgi:NAD(P)-dependent dehydrogenase (short-subunit alcohol dehydrogenase family)